MDVPRQPTLNESALGLSEAAVMGVAGTAPAFSIASTLAALVGAVGRLAPASLLYCGMAMVGTALAFLHLSRRRPDAGASFTWIGTIFHPVLGFLAGWTLLVSSALFMVSGTIPAATATLALTAPQLVENTTAVALVAAGWLLLVSAIVLKGIKASSYFQIAMTLVEVGVLVALILLALPSAGAGPSHGIGWRRLYGEGFTLDLFVSGALTALFFFWGWDVTANLNEETRGEGRLAGQASIVAMAVVLILFISFATVTLQLLDDKEIEAAGTNVILSVARKLLPGHWAELAVLAVVLSTIGTIETTILQFTRVLFVMARAGAMPARFARLHRGFRTPLEATALIMVLGLALLALSSTMPTVDMIIRDSVNAIGIQAAFYYGLTCLAAAWQARRSIRSAGLLVTAVAWPLLSAAALFAVALYSLPTLDLTALLIGAGGIVSGFVPLALARTARA